MRPLVFFFPSHQRLVIVQFTVDRSDSFSLRRLATEERYFCSDPNNWKLRKQRPIHIFTTCPHFQIDERLEREPMTLILNFDVNFEL